MTSCQPDIPNSPTSSYTFLPSMNNKDRKVPDSDVISLSSSMGSEKTTIADLQELDIDANTVLSALDSLLAIQKSVVDGLTRLRNNTQSGDWRTDNGDCGEVVVETTAQAATDLSTRSKRLRAIVEENVASDGRVSLYLTSGYAKSAREKEQDNALDMGASIYKWSSDCIITMLGLQEDVDQLIKQDGFDGTRTGKDAEKEKQEEHDFDDLASISDSESWTESMVLDEMDDAELVVTLHRHVEPLLGLMDRAEDLLRIIDDIATTRKNFTPVQTPVTSGANYSYRATTRDLPNTPREPIAAYPKAQPETPYTLLRRELYALKDRLKEQRLYPWYQAIFRNKASQTEPNMICYNDLEYAYTIVEELLSNNGEDWLASEKYGRMSFATFQNLDREWIYQLRVKLELEGKIQNEFHGQRVPGRLQQDASGINDATSDTDRLAGILKEILVMLGDRRLPATMDRNSGVSGVDSDKMVERLAVLGDW